MRIFTNKLSCSLRWCGTGRFQEPLNKLIPFTPFDRLRRAFDKLPPAAARAGTTNGINRLPFVLSPSTSLSKDLIRASFTGR